MQRNGKILIIGIDGGTFDIIRPLVQQGKLPNLAALMTAGASAELSSTIPPITAPAWVSFMTGKNPGKHSVFHFIGNVHKTYSGHAVSATDIKAKTLWSILSEHGKRLVLVNVPVTYPPMKINGGMISGMGTPSEDHLFTYPPDIQYELLQRVKGYTIDSGGISNIREASVHSLDQLIQDLCTMTDKRTEAVLYLMEKYEWDFFMVVYILADRLQHFFWRFTDPTHPDHDPKLLQRYGHVIFEGYQKVDDAIGRILKRISGDLTVIVLSDHGFGPLHKYFLVDKWLMQQGLLKLKRTLPWRLQLTHPSIQQILSKLEMNFMAQILPEKMRQLTIPRMKRVPKSLEALIDWGKTKVYFDQLGLNINLQGREPQGIVKPGDEFEMLLRELTAELYQLKDPETGEVVVDAVVRKEQVYAGPYIEEAPDLLFSMKGLSYVPSLGGMSSRGIFGPPPWSGNHRFEGILIMQGAEIGRETQLKKARIIDIAPTLLYLFDIPVPRDMDGRVLEESIHPDVLAARPVTYTEFTGQDGAQEAGYLLSVEDEERVRKRLIDLGYLS
jgi:predicted AlkP superfamily phosphohydrolase/phosphomutase